MTNQNRMQFFIGGDHAGFDLKSKIKEKFDKEGVEYIDLGAFSEEAMDYPDIAQEVGEKVRENPGSLGILICGSGVGVSMAANKMKGIRAALCLTPEMAAKSREHNNANVLAVGARITDEGTVMKMIDAFRSTEFSTDERHHRRVEKINTINR
jgi:ribose 5-phosphate isomerase B